MRILLKREEVKNKNLMFLKEEMKKKKVISIDAFPEMGEVFFVALC